MMSIVLAKNQLKDITVICNCNTCASSEKDNYNTSARFNIPSMPWVISSPCIQECYTRVARWVVSAFLLWKLWWSSTWISYRTCIWSIWEDSKTIKMLYRDGWNWQKNTKLLISLYLWGSKNKLETINHNKSYSYLSNLQDVTLADGQVYFEF